MTKQGFPQIHLSTLSPYPGSRHRRKLLGRGEGSGHGQTATRGMKGQRSRSGDTRMVGFEGGQTPLIRRIPKRGFNNSNFHRKFAVVNLDVLERFFSSGDRVTRQELSRLDIIRRKNLPIKVLGTGKLSKNLTVCVESISESARKAVEQAGGRVEPVTENGKRETGNVQKA